VKPAIRFVTIVPLAALFGATSAASPAFAQDGPAPVPAAEPASPAPETSDVPASPPATEPAPAASPSPAPPVSDPPSELPVLASGGVATGGRNDTSDGEPDDGALRHHQDHFLGFAGVRVGKISSEGLDPFSDSDELAQFSLGFGKTLMTAGNFSLAGLVLYDVGGHSGEARGAESELIVHRLTAGVEARYHFIRQLFVFGRVAPGAVHSIAKLEDQTAGAVTLAARNWVFATDLSAGAMFELSGWSGNSKKRGLGVWLTFDGGYGITGESELTLTADGGGGPERAEPVELGPLALGGPFLRFAAVVTY
jgi:hypothetical protein